MKNGTKPIASIVFDQKERLNFLWRYIKKQEKNFINDMVPKSDLIELYKQEKLESLDEDIERLKIDGIIYEPRTERYKTV
jgi:hypothetical protein